MMYLRPVLTYLEWMSTLHLLHRLLTQWPGKSEKTYEWLNHGSTLFPQASFWCCGTSCWTGWGNRLVALLWAAAAPDPPDNTCYRPRRRVRRTYICDISSVWMIKCRWSMSPRWLWHCRFSVDSVLSSAISCGNCWQQWQITTEEWLQKRCDCALHILHRHSPGDRPAGLVNTSTLSEIHRCHWFKKLPSVSYFLVLVRPDTCFADLSLSCANSVRTSTTRQPVSTVVSC